VIAATFIGGASDVSRFPGRGHFAAYSGTAADRGVLRETHAYRLSRRGTAISAMPPTWPRTVAVHEFEERLGARGWRSRLRG
jgi:hypothetical protein